MYILCISLFSTSLSGQSQTANDYWTQSFVKEGINVEVVFIPVKVQKEDGKFREGDDVKVRFTITDTVTGSGLAGAYPAAWLDLRRAENGDCIRKIPDFISGSILNKATQDLNVYFVLALNDDNTISVVDPLFEFGGSKLLSLIQLESPGMDWTLSGDENMLFVSMPASQQVAMIDNQSWTVKRNIGIGGKPLKMKRQSDDQYIWVAYQDTQNEESPSGVAVIEVATGKFVKQIETGRGWHDIAIAGDNQYAFVTNMKDGTVSVIDIQRLEKVRDIETGMQPFSIDWSSAARAVYVTHKGDNTVVGIDDRGKGTFTKIQVHDGISTISFAPGGRYGFIINPRHDELHILDVSSNRIVQTGDMEDQPDQVAFSDELAYIRHRGSETVLMIPLGEVGREGQAIPAADIPAGQNPPGKCEVPSPAAGIVQAPGASAVLISNPLDEAIYFYKEGMAAPMGSFDNYDRKPRAVLAVDRSLREKETGVYETTIKLRKPGIYDVPFFMNSPRMLHCFEFEVATDRDQKLENLIENMGPLAALPVFDERKFPLNQDFSLAFDIYDLRSKARLTGLKDVQIMIMRNSGAWSTRSTARENPDAPGTYSIDFSTAVAGIYYIYVQCESKGFSFNNPQYTVIEVKQEN